MPWTQRWLDPVWSGLNGGTIFDPEEIKYKIDSENNVAMLAHWLSYLDDLYGGDIEAFNVISAWGDVYPNSAFNLGLAAIDMSGAWAPTLCPQHRTVSIERRWTDLQRAQSCARRQPRSVDSSERSAADDQSNDGGANVSFNGGETWSEQDQATAQFYRVALDNDFPYHVYGAQQDNSTVRIVSRTSGFGITTSEWEESAGAESGRNGLVWWPPPWLHGPTATR